MMSYNIFLICLYVVSVSCQAKKQIVLRQNFYESLHSSISFDLISSLAESIYQSATSGGKVILYGNGGSCTQASHFATELSVRYKSGSIRKSIPAFNLASDPSFLSAVSNDFDWEDSFCHGLKSLAKSKDTIIGFSTSGSSPNVVKAHSWALNSDVNAFLIIGKKNISQKLYSIDKNIFSPPTDLSTALAQEFHLFLIHFVCEILESYA